jgi:N-methylhydantoinase B
VTDVRSQTRPQFADDDVDPEAELEPVTRQIISGNLLNICDEMGHRLTRMSYSNTIRESEDFGCALLDEAGRQLCETDSTPLQMGPIPAYVRGVIDVFEERGESFSPGDIVVHNDPYRGASHAPDIGVIVPVFYDDTLTGFSVTTAHHVDVGANEPGTCIVDTIDAYSESIRLRALKLEAGGERNHAVEQFIADNVRTPKMTLGDLEAQIAAAAVGVERLTELFDNQGHRTVKVAGEAVMNYSERRLREVISEVPDGTYSAEGYVDGFPDSEDPSEKDVLLAVDLTVSGDSIDVDLSRCADQLDARPINMPFEGTVVPAVLLTIRSTLLDTVDHDAVPQNDGITRPVDIHAPHGSIANPRFPAPTIARFCPGNRLADLTLRAIAQAAPERACAGTGNTKTVTFSGTSDEEYWMHMDIGSASYGGRPRSDGMDAVDTLFANTRNDSIEDIESHQPLRLAQYELREEGAGAGKYRGGFGPIREVELLADRGRVSIEGDGDRHPPWGFDGGEDGSTGTVVLETGEGTLELPANLSNRTVEGGARMRTVAPCGGGWGAPLEREPAAVRDDVRDDLLDRATAREAYGVVLDDNLAVDEAATADLRSERRE